ncbi:uncharacterized protein BCR38DRAFT_164284 [Pseudomassariella vexata]|uniref:Uncharacterized protein n=1 Tax=Pseudomassariella vexata TaxID=1141098 RepID=A0A1Y2E866_9PEZI|nr:uncharacterized protein BCR38DRAFT_164284 [Pseudomassariella vexata]ORY67763.1 hypothetical protein BCR38DRAFT_164284 [Pseudomassariella vexata]
MAKSNLPKHYRAQGAIQSLRNVLSIRPSPSKPALKRSDNNANLSPPSRLVSGPQSPTELRKRTARQLFPAPVSFPRVDLGTPVLGQFEKQSSRDQSLQLVLGTPIIS